MVSNPTRKKTIASLLALAVFLSLLFAPAGVKPAQAVTLPEVVVSCRIEPAQVRVGDTATLVVEVSEVPGELMVDGVLTPSGMNVYDMEMSFPTNGAISFLEASPRPGPKPWNNPFTPAGENVIDPTTGTIKAFGMVDPEATRFSGKGILFTAPLKINSKAPAAISFSSVSIPIYNDFWHNYNVDAQPCTVVLAPDLPPVLQVFLPIIQR